MFRRLCLLLIPIMLVSCSKYNDKPRETAAPGFVYLEGTNFALDGMPWFPMMINYKVDWHGTEMVPASYYGDSGSMMDHFLMMSEAGFNAVRVCMDVVNSDDKGFFFNSEAYLVRDSAAIFSSVGRMLDCADSAGLRVMLLIRKPVDDDVAVFTQALLRHFAGCKTLFAYDFFNEPLYFDEQKDRTKKEAYDLVKEWRGWMDKYAPHQLFTVALSEPIEVFVWDASILPVDFVEIHTYHPMRVCNEMYWYGHAVGKPWMVGETALPADGETVSFEAQREFFLHTFSQALLNGACGYGWWEFGNCPQGVNFEAQYPGLFLPEPKPVLEEIRKLKAQHEPHIEKLKTDGIPTVYETYLWWAGEQKACSPAIGNYTNMLGYENIMLEGDIVDDRTGKPLAWAVIRGWNRDWSVGVNTFTDQNGHFCLFSNDSCVYFTLSAPGYQTPAQFLKDNYQLNDVNGNPVLSVELPNLKREYQQIPLLEPMKDINRNNFKGYRGYLGTFRLKRL